MATTSSSTSQSSQLAAAAEQRTQAAAAEAAQIEGEATQDALWRMAQNNAMAKLRGFNTLAKSANDMA